MTENKNTNKNAPLVGVFHNLSEAKHAVSQLKTAGFDESNIGVASKDKDGTFKEQTESNSAGKGAALGATAGLGAGALWGIGIIAGVLPAIGPVIAGGALAAIAASAASTAAAGGVIGALIGMGVTEEEAKYYESEFDAGKALVTVDCAADKKATAAAILDGANSYDYARRESDYARNPAADKRLDSKGTLVARKEVLDIDKSVKAVGEVSVRKEVHTHTEHVAVPVSKEELVIERTELSGKEGGSIGDASTTQERIVLREEQVQVNKKTVEKEAVKVGKKVVQGTEKVAAKLREEDIVVEQRSATHTPAPNA